MTPRPMSTATTDRKVPFLSRAGRWVAELVLVFVGVYAAFWLNNYQQYRQDAERRDRILASIEQTLREGIESGKINRAKEEREARATSPRCFNPANPIRTATKSLT